MKDISTTKEFYDHSYMEEGINAQRQYPNEELCRFMGRNFFDRGISLEQRKNIRVLELGCGSCANIWMLAREGFDVYGCDLSSEAIKVGELTLQKWNVHATLDVYDMTNTNYPNDYFDIVIDVFSSNCIDRKNYKRMLKESKRIMKNGARFFSYFPSKRADTYCRSKKEDRLDIDTLKSIQDKKSPYYGQNYPFRFMSEEDVIELFSEANFNIVRLERCGRTYDNGQEYFEWLVFEAVLNSK